MIKAILDRFWPVFPWVDQLVSDLTNEAGDFDPVPLYKDAGEVLELDEDPFRIVCNTGAFKVLGVEVYVWPDKVGVKSMFCPEGYKLNWRENWRLFNAVEDWKDAHLDAWWAERLESDDDQEFDANAERITREVLGSDVARTINPHATSVNEL